MVEAGNEAVEMKIKTTLNSKVLVSVYGQDDLQEGPDDEFRELMKEETRDEDDVGLLSNSNNKSNSNHNHNHNHNELRANGASERTTSEYKSTEEDTDVREEPELTSIEKEESFQGDEDHSPSIVESGTQNTSSLDALQNVLSSQSTSVALFDDALWDADEEDTEDETTSHNKTTTIDMDVDINLDTNFDTDTDTNTNAGDDDHTVESRSKSVVDESTKNVDKAEALAKEMQRLLAESLAGFTSATPSPSMDDMGGDNDNKDGNKKQQHTGGNNNIDSNSRAILANHPATIDENDLDQQGQQRGFLHPHGDSSSATDLDVSVGHTPQNSSAFYYSEQKILKLATVPVPSPDGSNGGIDDAVSDEQKHHVDVSSFHSRSTDGSGSLPGTTAVPLQRQRPSFRYRRPLINSTIVGDLGHANASSTLNTSSASTPTTQSLPLSRHKQFQRVLESIVMPALFLVAAVAICRYFFHPWLRVGNEQSTAWALVWTILCIAAVMAPVFALEYMLLSGLLAGTALQKALQKYPDVKNFFKDVRRIRLQAGWWYPSEVRTLRNDLEATNAEIVLKQQQQLGDDQETRSLQRLRSREQEHRERVLLEKLVDNERAGWVAVKEQLVASISVEKEQTAVFREKLEKEENKHKELASCKEQLEEDMEAERDAWNATRTRLEEALKMAVASLKDETNQSNLLSHMRIEREEERADWQTERERFQTKIQQAEEKTVRIQQELETKIHELDEVQATKQAEWNTECKSLNEALKNASEEKKAMKEDLECEICKLEDVQDIERAEMETERGTFQNSISELQDELKSERTRVQELENLKTVLVEEICQLGEFQDIERAEMETNLDTLQKLISELQEERDTERTRVQELDTLKTNLEDEICQLGEAQNFERVEMETERDALQKSLDKLQEERVTERARNEEIENFKDKLDVEKADMDTERVIFQKLIGELQEERDTERARTQELQHLNANLNEEVCQLKDTQNNERAEMEAERDTFENSIVELEEERNTKCARVQELENLKTRLEEEVCRLVEMQEIGRAEMKTERDAFEESIAELEEELDIERARVQELETLNTIREEERTEWNSIRVKLESALLTADSDRKDSQQQLEQTETIFKEERAIWQSARGTFEESLDTSIAKVEDEANRIKTRLQQDLLQKEHRIQQLEGSIVQLENIISIQKTIEKNNEEKEKQEADREADRDSSGVSYFGDVEEGAEMKLQTSPSIRSSRSIEQSSSNVSSGDNTCASEFSSYHSWVQKIQETHSKEQRQLLRGLLTQHLQRQHANRHVGQLLASSRAMLEATDLSSETSEGAETFGVCLMQYTAASVAAKRYMDDLISKTGHEDILEIQTIPSSVSSDIGEDANDSSVRSNRSVAIMSNPWLRNAPLWEQVWSSLLMAKTSPFKICQSAMQRLCTGMVSGAGAKPSMAPSTWGISSMFLR
eukprot:CAMPEP_0168178764 /NCGR_PEP_ID=MMETSP0139_2-20121125/9379_1 /TAXON_ID=44445 /ORGANISM="Pseudo-nitzschia australis, Strain 10249 10 AB" /LENGTH=1440 /DNA_ID=CAMNT_0008098339 /DNA_START=206 /DNA_END=4524 /DNA_ORIENTATION=-